MTASPPRKRPWYLSLGLGLGAAVVIVVIVAIVRPRTQTDYDDAVRDRFLVACTEQGGEPVRQTCECFYGKLEQNIAFDRFEMLDETLQTQTQNTVPGESLTLPEDIAALLDECVDETGGS